MEKDQKICIGLFGFGVVGEGIYKVLTENPTLQAFIKKICIRHPEKERSAPAHLFTTDYGVLLNDPEITLIVELIDDADEAYRIITAAFEKGKSVISANKKCIAEHLPDLISESKKQKLSFLYEAAVCGSIPVIRNLEEYFDTDLLQQVSGIVNGSTNYILTQMTEGLTYNEALLEAQQKGFAESNPALDVEAWDAANKLSILLVHAYGILKHPHTILRKGITSLHPADSAYATEKGLRIKLVASAQKLISGGVAAYVLPQFVPVQSQLYAVQNEYNGVQVESKLADKQFFYGKGAGRYPTSSAVVSDISAFRHQYKYEYKKLNRDEKAVCSTDYYLDVYVSFPSWNALNKWDFEELTEFHSTANRQYLKGRIGAEKLLQSEWFHSPDVSVILLPDGLVEKDKALMQSLKKVSLQLAGI